MSNRNRNLLLILFLPFIFTVLLLPTRAEEPIWLENFEGYPTGANMHGLGGWKGWLNDPAFTAYTSNKEAWSGWNSLEISATADLVHEYSVHSGRIRYGFYQFIPQTFRGRSNFIMLNQYDDEGNTNNWSVQVSYFNASGQMVDDATGASMPYVGDRWVWVCIDIDLDNDAQAFIYDGNIFYTGSWSNHVSGGGSTSIAAVDLYANGGSSVYYDGMIMDTRSCFEPPPEPPPVYILHLPFIIRQ